MAKIGMVKARWEESVGHRLDAVRRLRETRERIGPKAYALIVAVAAEDVSWRELGRRLGVTDKTAQNAAVKALEALAR